MAIYVGIDLGTTNSAICTYDGKETKVWKSSEQNDVTPSAIYIDRRGNTQYGLRAIMRPPRHRAMRRRYLNALWARAH